MFRTKHQDRFIQLSQKVISLSPSLSVTCAKKWSTTSPQRTRNMPGLRLHLRYFALIRQSLTPGQRLGFKDVGSPGKVGTL